MKDITTDMLETVNGGALGGLTTAPTRRNSSSSSSSTLSTALTGVTSALDSLKSNQNKSSTDQLLPLVLMAKFIRQG